MRTIDQALNDLRRSELGGLALQREEREEWPFALLVGPSIWGAFRTAQGAMLGAAHCCAAIGSERFDREAYMVDLRTGNDSEAIRAENDRPTVREPRLTYTRV